MVLYQKKAVNLGSLSQKRRKIGEENFDSKRHVPRTGHDIRPSKHKPRLPQSVLCATRKRRWG